MKTARGDSAWLWLFLTASLLMHLLLLTAVGRVAVDETVHGATTFLSVDLVQPPPSPDRPARRPLPRPPWKTSASNAAMQAVTDHPPTSSVPAVPAKTGKEHGPTAVSVRQTDAMEQHGSPGRVLLQAGAAPGSSGPHAGSAAGEAGVGRHTEGSEGGTIAAEPTAMALQRQNAYQLELRRLIEACKTYPFAARRAGHTGSCQRRFVLNRSGGLMQLEALTSCGHPLLDEAATSAITAVGTFPPLPEAFRGSKAIFTVTITFNLTTR